MRRETLATADEREREINHAFLPHLEYSMEQYVPYYVGTQAYMSLYLVTIRNTARPTSSKDCLRFLLGIQAMKSGSSNDDKTAV